MKKLIIISSLTILGAITLVSCEKKQDWTCRCTISDSGFAITQDFPIIDMKKKDAEKSCQSMTTSIAGTSVSCGIL